MIYITATKDRTSDNNSNTNAAPPVLNITSCPEQVTSDNPYVTISGTLKSDTVSCTLTINGEVITSSNAAGAQIQWSKTYQLQSGETKTLQFEARDANNRVTTMTKSVFCQPLQKQQTARKRAPITPGCTLVKKNKNGLNIRAYPGTNYGVVAYISANDFTSEMVFTGHYQVAYDGYTWYEVIAPNGMHGYVRSDLVQSNTFLD